MSECSNNVVLEARNVTRQVITSSNKFKTVDDISFFFNKGNIYNIIGPSGAGKSSFLRLINRLDEPTSGEILYNNRPITFYEPTQLRKNLSLIFQEPFLFPGTVGANLDYCKDGCTRGNIEFQLDRVGLNPKFIDKDVSELSVGEKQRVAFARSIMLDPEVLLLDEPTSALDPSSAQTIERLILSLIKDLCLTAIMITHNPEQAQRMSGYTLLLVNGKLIESGETTEILTNPKTEAGQKYINRELR